MTEEYLEVDAAADVAVAVIRDKLIRPSNDNVIRLSDVVGVHSARLAARWEFRHEPIPVTTAALEAAVKVYRSTLMIGHLHAAARLMASTGLPASGLSATDDQWRMNRLSIRPRPVKAEMWGAPLALTLVKAAVSAEPKKRKCSICLLDEDETVFPESGSRCKPCKAAYMRDLRARRSGGDSTAAAA